MRTGVAVWLSLRAVRWLFGLAFLAYSVEFVLNRPRHLNSFGQLNFSTEMCFFGLAVGFVFAGLLELMARDWAGLQHPKFGQLIPPAGAALTDRR